LIKTGKSVEKQQRESIEIAPSGLIFARMNAFIPFKPMNDDRVTLNSFASFKQTTAQIASVPIKNKEARITKQKPESLVIIIDVFRIPSNSQFPTVTSVMPNSRPTSQFAKLLPQRFAFEPHTEHPIVKFVNVQPSSEISQSEIASPVPPCADEKLHRARK
jgi:hypothetical protein